MFGISDPKNSSYYIMSSFKTFVCKKKYMLQRIKRLRNNFDILYIVK